MTVWSSELEPVLSELNQLAAKYILAGNYAHALDLLMQAEHHTRPSLDAASSMVLPIRESSNGELSRLHHRCVTLNNLACLEQKRGNFQEAYGHLSAAIALGCHTPHTLLNAVAVLEKLGKHPEVAVGYAKVAIRIITESLLHSDFLQRIPPHRMTDLHSEIAVNAKELLEPTATAAAQDAKQVAEMVRLSHMLVLAHLYVAHALERCCQSFSTAVATSSGLELIAEKRKAALGEYQRAYSLAESVLGPDHSLTLQVMNYWCQFVNQFCGGHCSDSPKPPSRNSGSSSSQTQQPPSPSRVDFLQSFTPSFSKLVPGTTSNTNYGAVRHSHCVPNSKLMNHSPPFMNAGTNNSPPQKLPYRQLFTPEQRNVSPSYSPPPRPPASPINAIYPTQLFANTSVNMSTFSHSPPPIPPRSPPPTRSAHRNPQSSGSPPSKPPTVSPNRLGPQYCPRKSHYSPKDVPSTALSGPRDHGANSTVFLQVSVGEAVTAITPPPRITPPLLPGCGYDAWKHWFESPQQPQTAVVVGRNSLLDLSGPRGVNFSGNYAVPGSLPPQRFLGVSPNVSMAAAAAAARTPSPKPNRSPIFLAAPPPSTSARMSPKVPPVIARPQAVIPMEQFVDTRVPRYARHTVSSINQRKPKVWDPVLSLSPDTMEPQPLSLRGQVGSTTRGLWTQPRKEVK